MLSFLTPLLIDALICYVCCSMLYCTATVIVLSAVDTLISGFRDPPVLSHLPSHHIYLILFFFFFNNYLKNVFSICILRRIVNWMPTVMNTPWRKTGEVT